MTEHEILEASKQQETEQRTGKKLSKLNGSDKSFLRWLAGNIHVAESDEAVKARLRKSIDYSRLTPGCQRQADKVALAAHHENRRLFTSLNFIA